MDRLTVTFKGSGGKTEINVPPSKSYMHRYLIASALCGESCVTSNMIYSKDAEATLGCIRALGGTTVQNQNSVVVSGPLNKKNCVLDCNESASTLRFFIPISIISENQVRFTGKSSLMLRPLSVYEDNFKLHGIKYELKPGSHFTVDGRLSPGRYYVDGNVSSQFITGLLFALPLLEGDSAIIVNGALQSVPYIDITLDVLKQAGISIQNDGYKVFYVKGGQKYARKDYTVQGDYSQAAFFIVAGLFVGNMTVHNLNEQSIQGDKAIIGFLKKMGGKISFENGSLKIEKSDLSYTGSFDVAHCPDIVPILALACAVNNGKIVLQNTGRLKIKECDRGAAITEVITKMGGKIKNLENSIEIEGVKKLTGCTVSSYNDHRMAMTEAVASLVCEGAVQILEPQSIEKSYPGFYQDFEKIGGVHYEWNMGE